MVGFCIKNQKLKCNWIWTEPVPMSNFSCLYLVTVSIILTYILSYSQTVGLIL